MTTKQEIPGGGWENPFCSIVAYDDNAPTNFTTSSPRVSNDDDGGGQKFPFFNGENTTRACRAPKGSGPRRFIKIIVPKRFYRRARS